ncbi:transposase [Streptococcus pneumoniae]|nr:transposase [Streptococcus pneumoniae]
MEQLHFITKLLDIKDPNIQILDIINKDTHKEIIAKLDYDAPSCPECGSQMKKYDFQKPSKIPYLETTGMPTRILLRKRRFKCYHCSKMMVAETSIVKKNHQIPRIINQKIAEITCQFIRDMLDLPAKNVTILEGSDIHVLLSMPYSVQDFYTSIDVLAELDNGTQVIIEIQVHHQNFFINHLWTYLCSQVNQNLEKIRQREGDTH